MIIKVLLNFLVFIIIIVARLDYFGYFLREFLGFEVRLWCFVSFTLLWGFLGIWWGIGSWWIFGRRGRDGLGGVVVCWLLFLIVSIFLIFGSFFAFVRRFLVFCRCFECKIWVFRLCLGSILGKCRLLFWVILSFFGRIFCRWLSIAWYLGLFYRYLCGRIAIGRIFVPCFWSIADYLLKCCLGLSSFGAILHRISRNLILFSLLRIFHMVPILQPI